MSQPAGPDDPTTRFGPPGQREPTRRLDRPEPYDAVYGPPQTPYGRTPYGGPTYGQPAYEQPVYGQPSYGPPWAAPAAPPGPPPKTNRTLTIALVVAAVVVLAAGGVLLWLLIGRGVDASSLPPATGTPEGLGGDPFLDAYAVDCYEGSMQACDDLFIEAEPGSRYETYGDTCAGRQPPGTNVFCTVSFPAG